MTDLSVTDLFSFWKGKSISDSPLLLHKEKLLNTWRYKLLHFPQQAILLSDQTSPHSYWQSIWGSPMCARGPGSAPAPWQQVVVSGTQGWDAWRGTPSPGPAGASPPSPLELTATRCQGTGMKSRSWQREGAPGWGWQSRTGCISRTSRTPCCGGQKSVWRSSRAPRSWSRRQTGCSELCPGPSCPCEDCRLAQSSDAPRLDLCLWRVLVRDDITNN